ncbi:MAG: TolC family protein [Chitinophagaceae bacterium]|nr:TolC family protein [Chitinophagaceae bacterium]
MQNRLLRISTAVLLLLGSHSAFSQQQNSFTANQCVEYAMKNSAQVKNSLLDIKIQNETNREYTAAAYPHLGASVGVNYFPNVATQVFPNFIAAATYGVLEKEGVKDGNGNSIVMPGDFGYVQAQFGTKYNASAGFELQQLLFDGQVFVGLQARSTALKFSEKTAEVTQENIKANILKIYYQLVAGKDQLGALDANIARVEKLLHETKEMFKNGFVEKLDIDKLDVSLINLQTEKLKIVRSLEIGNMGLKVLMGMPVKDNLILTDSLKESELKKDILDQNFNYSDRKDIQQMELGVRLREYNVRRYELAKLPSIALVGQLTTQAQRNKFDFFSAQKWYPSSLIGIKISAPIFAGFSRNAQINRAKYELEQVKNNMNLMKLSVDNELERARLQFQTALTAMDFQHRNMDLAENVYKTTVKKYEQGLGSNIEITAAQTELRVAESSYFNSLYEAIVARVDLIKALGKL